MWSRMNSLMALWKTVGLEYKFQSGALNEAFCDIMAVMVDDDDWEIAEDIPNGPIRDVSSPGRFGLPGHMSEYYDLRLDQDYGGVHINMGIPSRAAYLVAEVIGRGKTADIWYRVLHNLYLTPKSQFVDMRLAAIRSAKDLFGDDSAEAAAVAYAFDTVGIEDAAPTVPPANAAPVTGDEYIAFVYENGPHGSLALARPDADSVTDFVYPTNTYVFTDGSSPVTVCRNGSFLMFVDESSNIRKIDLATMEETVIEYSGIWSSIKLSPDGCRLAATTINADSTIYVIDLDVPENSKAIPLYTASTEGVKSKTAVMADALDWDATSTHILYDAFHSLPVAGGSPIEFWDVNLLDVETGIITRIATPTDNGTQVGNPSFAETNDRYIVCDMFSTMENRNSMIAIDLYTNELKELRNNGMVMTGIPNLGHPKYSPDDSNVIFQQYSLSYRRFIVYTMPIQSDRMTADGMVKAFAFGYLPDWFVLGKEELPTHAEEDSSPAFITLSQNTPNPFNPVTTIPFSVGESGLVRIRVYDALGRTVATLVEDVLPAGSHRVRFDGKDCASGVYFCRLETGGMSRNIRMLLVK